VASDDWNNRGLQDVLPTWRWINRTNGTPLEVSMTWDDAYYGGTSLRIQGDLDAPNVIGLFKTQVDLVDEASLEVAFKTGQAGPSHLEIGLRFSGGAPRLESIPVGPANDAGWNTARISLAPYAGRRLLMIALRVDSDTLIPNYDLLVGRVGLLEGARDIPGAPSDLRIEDSVEVDPMTAALRLGWTGSPDATYSYNTYRRNTDGSRTHLGSSPSTAYFVAALRREGSETETTIEVEAVSPEFGHSATAETTYLWKTRLPGADAL